MTKKTIVGFVMVSLSLVACAAQSAPDSTGAGADEEATKATAEALQIDPNPAAGESCHAKGAGVTNGTMTNSGWCCGVATCGDKQTCGNDYGHLVSTCAACDWYKCDPGSSIIAGTGSLEQLDLNGGKVEIVSKGPDFILPYAPPKGTK